MESVMNRLNIEIDLSDDGVWIFIYGDVPSVTYEFATLSDALEALPNLKEVCDETK